MAYGVKYPWGQPGPAVLVVSPPCFLCTLSLLAVLWGVEKALTLRKHCSVIAKMSLSYQHYFQHKSQTYQLLWKKKVALCKSKPQAHTWSSHSFQWYHVLSKKCYTNLFFFLIVSLIHLFWNYWKYYFEVSICLWGCSLETSFFFSIGSYFTLNFKVHHF